MRRKIKGFFFSQIPQNGLGPQKKVHDQIKTFAKNGIELELVESPFQVNGLIRGHFILRQIVCRLPFTYVYSKHKYKEEYKNADMYYIRFLAGDVWFSRFLRLLKKNNPTAKIIMELPDYPTTWYMIENPVYILLYFPIIIKDILARRAYRKYVDIIATPADVENAFGIEVLHFLNGIDVESIEEKKPCGVDKIKMIAVAGMCDFHGYDRLIKGLGVYYKNGGIREIELHMVGGELNPGSVLGYYISLAKEYEIEEKIFFYGTKKDKELDDIYNKCNLAVASLGMFRAGYNLVSSLKTREYLAKGLPMITGCDIDVFCEQQFDYECKFPNDESLIDIDRLAFFFDKIYRDKNEQEIIREIRKFAINTCDSNITLRPVIEFMTEI